MRVEFPGLVDIQVNGFAGIDFNSPSVTADEIRGTLPAMRATGVTRCLPTIITGSLESFARCARTLNEVQDPAFAGIHMEGPYISPTDESPVDGAAELRAMVRETAAISVGRFLGYRRLMNLDDSVRNTGG